MGVSTEAGLLVVALGLGAVLLARYWSPMMAQSLTVALAVGLCVASVFLGCCAFMGLAWSAHTSFLVMILCLTYPLTSFFSATAAFMRLKRAPVAALACLVLPLLQGVAILVGWLFDRATNGV